MPGIFDSLTKSRASGDLEALRREIGELTRANRGRRDVATERRLLRARHLAGVELQRSEPPARPEFAEPDFDSLPAGSGLPEVTPEELTPGLIRAAILRHGCLVVRNMVPRADAERFAEEIERGFAAREERKRTGNADGGGYFEEFGAEPGYDLESRAWVTDAGGIWAADSPRLMFEMLELLEGGRMTEMIPGYLGEAPAFSVQKCTLRRVGPDAGNGFPGWHQDGRFLGEVRALNVWLTLTRCGDEAPGLDLVPRRIDRILPTGTEGAIFDWVVSPQVVDEARGELAVERPIFEPGDAMLFDELFLHATAADPAMPNHRYAVESWFFGPSAFPGPYAPLAL